MSLRARIVTIVSVFFLGILAIAFAGSLYRESLIIERELTFVQSSHTMLAREIIAREAQTLTAQIDALDIQAILSRIQRGDDRNAIAQDLSKSGLRRSDVFEVLDASGKIMFGMTVDGHRNVPAIIDAAALDRVLQAGALSGLNFVLNEGLLVISAIRFGFEGNDPIIVVAGRSLSSALERYSRALGTPSLLAGLRGRMIFETQPGLSDMIGALGQLRGPAEKLSYRGEKYVVSKIILPDMLGDPEAVLLTFLNVSQTEARNQRTRWLVITVILFLLVAGAVALDMFLWRSFLPLEHAVKAVEALSRGDPDVVIETGRRDEIGRIASAAVQLRLSVLGLARARRQRKRIRNRLEKVINGALKDLSASLDEAGRKDIADLADVAEDGQGAENQLKRTALVLRRLTDRVLDQQARLQDMIVELQEAVVTKARLAGLEQELEIARHVQASMLPEPLPPNEYFAVHGMMEPAREVGGDFFDFFTIGNNEVGVVVADVSGKGVPAAFFMAIAKSLLRAIVFSGASPADAVKRLNIMLADHNDEMMFVTLFYGVLDLNTGEFAYVNAGHNPPLTLRQDGSVELLTGGDIALAVVDDFDFKEHRTVLRPGETVFLYTDGVTEACDPALCLFGDARLQAILSGHSPGLTPDAVCDVVYTAVQSFEAGANRADDITCVALRYTARKAN